MTRIHPGRSLGKGVHGAPLDVGRHRASLQPQGPGSMIAAAGYTALRLPTPGDPTGKNRERFFLRVYWEVSVRHIVLDRKVGE